MKARIRDNKVIGKELEREEFLRLNKLWLFAINQTFGFGRKRLLRLYKEFCKMSGELYNTPEWWFRVDEKIRGQYHMEDIFPAEDLVERESTLKQVHKENGQKWRCY